MKIEITLRRREQKKRNFFQLARDPLTSSVEEMFPFVRWISLLRAQNNHPEVYKHTRGGKKLYYWDMMMINIKGRYRGTIQTLCGNRKRFDGIARRLFFLRSQIQIRASRTEQIIGDLRASRTEQENVRIIVRVCSVLFCMHAKYEWPNTKSAKNTNSITYYLPQ